MDFQENYRQLFLPETEINIYKSVTDGNPDTLHFLLHYDTKKKSVIQNK